MFGNLLDDALTKKVSKSSASVPYNSYEYQFSLASTKPYHETEVAFESHAGHIVVKANLAGQWIEALVDTGARDIMWQHLPLLGSPTQQWFSFPHTYGRQVSAEFDVLPGVQIGGYRLIKPASVYLATDEAALIYTDDGKPLQVMLGNYAFKNIVLTIDYQRKKLIFRDPEYNLTQQHRRPQDCVLDFIAGGDAVKYSPEFLTVRGTVEGIPVPFVLDTGHYTNCILLSHPLRQRLTAVKQGAIQRSRIIMTGQPITEMTRPLHWTLGNLRGQCPGATIKMRPDWQAIIGYGILKDYRLTIDYSRSKVLLEPYPISDANH